MSTANQTTLDLILYEARPACEHRPPFAAILEVPPDLAAELGDGGLYADWRTRCNTWAAFTLAAAPRYKLVRV